MPWQLLSTTASLALALLAQHRLVHGAPPWQVAGLFLLSVGLAIRSMPGWESESNSPPAAPQPVAYPNTLIRRARRWLLVTAWLSLGGALILAAFEQGWPWDGLLWGVYLLAFVVSLADRAWLNSLRLPGRVEGLALALILGLALITRTYDLRHLPPAIHGDEAQFGLSARAILQGEQPNLFSVGWYEFPTATFAVQAGVMRLFGDHIGGLRLSSALFGAFALLPVYLLARSMFDHRVGLSAAGLMAVGHWPIHFSRLGINNIQTTFFAAWSVYLAWRALRTHHRLDYALTGLALGLGLYTYYAARSMPFVVGGIILVYLWRKNKQIGVTWSPHMPGLMALVVAGTLTIAPQVVYFVRHPHLLVSRQRGVFLFTNLPHLESAYHTQDWGQIMRQQTGKSLLVFNAQGDSSGQYGFDEPMLDWLMAGLMVAGLGLSLWRWRRGGHLALHLWFWPNLILGSVLTIDAPFVPRLVALMPVPYIWAGVALGGWWKSLSLSLERSSRQSLLAAIPVVSLLGLIGWANYDAYINRYIGQRRAMLDSTEAAHMMAALPNDTQVYLMGAHNIYAGFSTFRFVAPDTTVWDAVNVTDWAPIRQPVPGDVLFLIWPSHMDRLPYLQHVYPNGTFGQHTDQQGIPLFATYYVTDEVIRQRQRLAVTPPQTNAPNTIWRGTMWLPDDGSQQICQKPAGGTRTYLNIAQGHIQSTSSGDCLGNAPRLNLAAGPASIEVGGQEQDTTLYWRQNEESWEEVPAYLLWDEPEFGGLLGSFEQEGTVLRREVAPLIAYRDFARQFGGPVTGTWRGCLVIDRPGRYAFSLRTFDGARLIVDNQTIIQDDHQGQLEQSEAAIELETGEHSVQIEGLFTDGPRWMEWYWQPPDVNTGWALVPPDILIPDECCPVPE